MILFSISLSDCFPLSVGRLHVDKSIPKMEDTEKKMSSEFNGWVDTGGHWKPTKCKARVKVKLIRGALEYNFARNRSQSFQSSIFFFSYTFSSPGFSTAFSHGFVQPYKKAVI